MIPNKRHTHDHTAKTPREALSKDMHFYVAGLACPLTDANHFIIEVPAISFDVEDLHYTKKKGIQCPKKVHTWTDMVALIHKLLPLRYPTEEEMSKLSMVLMTYVNCAVGASIGMTFTTPQHSLGGKTWVRAMAELIVEKTNIMDADCKEKNIRATSMWLIGGSSPLGGPQAHSILSKEQLDDFTHTKDECQRICRGKCGIPETRLTATHPMLPLQHLLQHMTPRQVLGEQDASTHAAVYTAWLHRDVGKKKLSWTSLQLHDPECCCKTVGSMVCLQSLYLKSTRRNVEHAEKVTASETQQAPTKEDEMQEGCMNIMSIREDRDMADHLNVRTPLRNKSAKPYSGLCHHNLPLEPLKLKLHTRALNVTTDAEEPSDTPTAVIKALVATAEADEVIVPPIAVKKSSEKILAEVDNERDTAETALATALWRGDGLPLVVDDTRFPVIEQQRIMDELTEEDQKNRMIKAALASLMANDDSGNLEKEHNSSSGIRTLNKDVIESFVRGSMETFKDKQGETKAAKASIRRLVTIRIERHIADTLEKSIQARKQASEPTFEAPEGCTTWTIRTTSDGNAVEACVSEPNRSKRIAGAMVAQLARNTSVMLRRMEDKSLDATLGTVAGESSVDFTDTNGVACFTYQVIITRKGERIIVDVAPEQLLTVISAERNEVNKSKKRVEALFGAPSVVETMPDKSSAAPNTMATGPSLAPTAPEVQQEAPPTGALGADSADSPSAVHEKKRGRDLIDALTNNSPHTQTPAQAGLTPTPTNTPTLKLAMEALDGCLQSVDDLVTRASSSGSNMTITQRAMLYQQMDPETRTTAVSAAQVEYCAHAKDTQDDYYSHDTETVCFTCSRRLVTEPRASRPPGDTVWRHLYDEAADGSRTKRLAMTGTDGLACSEYAQCQKCPSAQQALGLELAPHMAEVCILAQRMFQCVAKCYGAITQAAQKSHPDDRRRTDVRSDAPRAMSSRSGARSGPASDRRSHRDNSTAPGRRAHRDNSPERRRQTRSRSRSNERSYGRAPSKSTVSAHSPAKAVKREHPE